MISAVVLTKNEENNIKACLESLKWCDEIVVVDDYSTTPLNVEVLQGYAGQAKLVLFRRYLNNDFSAQRNFGINKARGEWILFVDADERISSALQNEIQMENGKWKMENISGLYFRRQDYFLGRWLKYGETAHVRLLRLVKKGSGCWLRRVHETFKLKSGRTAELKNPILHYPHPSISEFLESINFHTDLHSQVLFEEGKRTNMLGIIFYPVGKICLNYFWRLGFLDGIQGLIMALMMSLHSFLARAKLYHKLNEKNK